MNTEAGSIKSDLAIRTGVRTAWQALKSRVDIRSILLVNKDVVSSREKLGMPVD